MAELGVAMESEILEQPRALAAAVEAAEALALPRAAAVVLFARGSSENAALYGRYLLEAVAGMPVVLGAPSLATLYGAPTDLDGWLAVGVSQSGETREIADCLRWARGRGARTLAVTNAAGSLLDSVADGTLVLGSSPERAVAATKTFTGECAALAALAYGWAEARPDWSAVHATLERAAAADPDEELVSLLASQRFALVLGRGYHVPLAQELALKLMEACGTWASGMSWADLVHGPIAAVPPNANCLVLPPGGPPGVSAGDVERRLRLAGLHVFRLESPADGTPMDQPLRPLVDAFPVQLAILAAARRLGLDPDAPSGLTKVTQT
jgi:glutamine---fructose-6-phosphate transaminase (isomerizing)